MSSANVLALIPARSGSKGIPGKNFTPLASVPPVMRAWTCAAAVGCDPIVVSTDEGGFDRRLVPHDVRWLERPAALAQDDTPMIDVVQHALAQIPGPPEQVVVLLQPTQPLREPKHVQAAIQLLRETQADSVVSVVELPATHDPLFVLRVDAAGGLATYGQWSDLGDLPLRQAVQMPLYIRDGTCYAFWRRTVEMYGNLYGQDVRPLIIPAEESCALDDMADWAEAERRLQGR